MKITLIINLNGTLIGLSFGTGKDITIGREIGNTIAPLSADGLSRHHARIFAKEDGWYVEDLGSTNGSYRMGKKLEAPEKLEQRDMLQFGKLEVSVDELSIEPDAVPVAAA
ncbi:MAG: FHA domain-containing protein, partial [Kiritimatiellae bacterium]|nr:FHA domain-containing protein [Kiritimatiellia bacterium]